MALGPHEFIRRFLMHVLPKGLHRIRPYGLLFANAERKQTIAQARQVLAVPAAEPGAMMPPGNVPAIVSVDPTAEDLANASRQLLRYRAEATVFLSGSPPTSLIDLTRCNGQTLILINRAETGLDSVRCDDRGGAQTGIRGAAREWGFQICGGQHGQSEPEPLRARAGLHPLLRHSAERI